MRYSSRYGQKGNSSYNVGKAKGHQDKDDYETRSAATTASTASSSHSDDERSMPPPPAPPAMPTKLRTKLTSGAALFVPQGLDAGMPPPPMIMPGGPTPGKDSLRGVIEGTLGSEVWDLSMVDCQGFTGEWYTAVAITIPALSASMVHLATSTDAELLATAQLATQTQAVQSLMHSLQGMSPQMKLSPTEDASRLSVEYCGADRDKLCWEFSHFGQCPRNATCRWQHAMVETFLISIMLQPILDAPWGWGQPQPPPASAPQEAQNSRWQPQRPPASAPQEVRKSRMSSLPLTKSLPLTSIERKGCYSGDDDDTPFPDHMQECDFGMEPEPKSLNKVSTPPTPVRRPRVGRSWADIQEDSDGDEVPLPSWN